MQHTHVATDHTSPSLRREEALLRANLALLAVLDEGPTPRGLAMVRHAQRVIDRFYHVWGDTMPQDAQPWRVVA